MEQPKKPLFDLVKYSTELGDMDAYLSTPLDQSKRYPAITLVTGGFPSGGVQKSIYSDPIDFDPIDF